MRFPDPVTVSQCLLCICHALQFLFPCPVSLRTKQYMQDRDFNASFLFYPGAIGSERLPPGLPLGAVVKRSCAYSQVQPLSRISHVQVLTTTIRYRRSTRTTCGNMLLFCNPLGCLKLRATSIVGQMGLCSAPRCWMYLRDSGGYSVISTIAVKDKKNRLQLVRILSQVLLPAGAMPKSWWRRACAGPVF